MVNMMKTDKEYKKLSIKEFNKAAEKYESGNAGIYEMCKRDYPPILEEIRKTEFENTSRCRMRNRSNDKPAPGGIQQ